MAYQYSYILLTIKSEYIFQMQNLNFNLNKIFLFNLIEFSVINNRRIQGKFKNG